MNNGNHERSNSLCSYHLESQLSCKCPYCLELILESASWKPEKLRIFHCNDCGGTTIREIRSLYIDGRVECLHSMNAMEHEWHCSYCDLLNSDSGSVSNHKNINLLVVKNLDSHHQTISNTSVLCKHSTSCFYHSQKHSFSIRSRSIQCKCSKKYNECEKYTKSGECDCLIINRSQLESSFIHKSKKMETIKCVKDQETSITGSASATIAMVSRKGLGTFPVCCFKFIILNLFIKDRN